MPNNKSVRLLLIISFILCVVTGIIIYGSYKEKAEAQSMVSATHDVIQTAIKLQAVFMEAETNHRGFLITRDTSFLRLYHRSIDALDATLGKIANLTKDNPVQQELINSKISPFLKDRITRMDETIQLFNNRKISQEQHVDRIRSARLRDDLIHEHIRMLISREEALLYTRQTRLDEITFFAKWVLYISVLLISVTTLLAYITIRRAQKENLNLVNSLDNINHDLEKKVEEQTAHIKEANLSLLTKNDDLNTLNEELRSSEEEVRAHLDFIISLQNELRKSEQLHRMLTENSMDIIAVFNIDNNFEYISPAVKRILGYEPADLIGTPGFNLLHPEDVMLLNSPQQIAVGGKELVNPHFRLRRKDGTYVWIEAHSSPIVDEHGNIIKIQAINRDITDRKAAEIATLEAKEKAEEATRIKSQFLSTMSHEIRTPMNAVIGLTTLLLENKPRPDQEEQLNLLKFSGESLLTIINDILDFSKIEAGKLVLESITFNLYDQLINLHRIHERKAREKGIDLILLFADEVPRVIKGDPVRISQIITNLVSNAIKFTSKGYVEIGVHSIPAGDKIYRISFSVKDTGLGIPKEKQVLIFESFSQANSDTTRKFGGTGLGLAITKNLVSLMKGEITVESSPGYGSTFLFSIPVEEGKMVDKEIKTMGATTAGTQEHYILLVEDNPVNQIVARNFLNKWGFKIDMAGHGKEALRMLDNKTYDLILMDLQMPEMDGFTAAQKIRERDSAYFKEIPIIALTAAATVDIKQKAMDYGMNDYVSKPFDPEELRSKILKYLPNDKPEPNNGRNTSLEAFHLFTKDEGEFKQHLALMIVENMKELQDVVNKITAHGENDLLQAIHKMKTAIKIVNNAELDHIIDSLKHELHAGNIADLSSYKNKFNSVINRLIEEFQKQST